MTNWKEAQAILPWMIEIRRDIHRHPELAFEEERTAARIIQELEALDIPYRYGGVGSGIVAQLGSAPPVVALRADMDALPGQERTQLTFRSQIPHKMHACGHDAHVAMLLGAVALLKQSPPPGTVQFVFQPAEEQGGGARVMLETGWLDETQAIFGLHVTRQYRTGQIMVAPGVITAQSDEMAIRVKGRGGHGARPHEATDAVIVAGLLINALQTLISRESNPFHPSVVTIGHVEAGSAANVIAEEALLEGSIRTTAPSARSRVLAGLKRMVKAAALLHDAHADVTIVEGYPPVINTPDEVEMARQAAVDVVGERGMAKMDFPSMGAEDFAYYLERIPGCYARLGVRAPGTEMIPLHSPAFDIDENAMSVGATFLERTARVAAAELASPGERP